MGADEGRGLLSPKQEEVIYQQRLSRQWLGSKEDFDIALRPERQSSELFH